MMSLEKDWGPVIKRAAADIANPQRVRDSYYKTSDGIVGLEDELRADPDLSRDRDLMHKFKVLQKAFATFGKALSRYNWD